MKTRTFVSILILVLAVLLVSSCATTSKTKVISQSESLSSDKAYLAGVFDYHIEFSRNPSYDPSSPILRLLGDNEERVILEFPYPYIGRKNKPSGILLVVVEVEPGEYTAESIYKVETYSNFRFSARNIMGIPPKLKDKITVESGSITYLGDFSIIKRTSSKILFKVVSYDCKYEYEFEKFRNKLKLEYIVPENIELSSL